MPSSQRAPRSRASKACTLCRRQKSRCYSGALGSKSCLRCSTLAEPCSLEISEPPSIEADATTISSRLTDKNFALLEERVRQLEQTVLNLANANVVEQDDTTEPILSRHVLSNAEQPHSHSTENAVMGTAAPLEIIREAANIEYVSEPTAGKKHSLNIIEKGILNSQDVQDLLTVFRKHYGRWIAIDEMDNTLFSIASDSPFLLCACCLIAVRHVDIVDSARKARLLYDETMALLKDALLSPGQDFNFYRAIVILSLWPTTIANSPVLVDSWIITGFTLQHRYILDCLGAHVNGDGDRDDTRMRLTVRTHLYLSHLLSCIGNRRTCMLTSSNIVDCLREAEEANLANFGKRILAELDIYWIIFEQSVAAAVALPKAQAALQQWRTKWGFLFDESRSQFLSMAYDFAQLLLYQQALKARSAAVRESLLIEMVRLCQSIMDLATQSEDERTPHLTDHVYHTIAFAGITLCRLLIKYEQKIGLQFDTQILHAKVRALVSRLRAIGKTAPVSRLMAGVVEVALGRLSNGSRDVDSAVPLNTELVPEDSSFLPDFLDLETFNSNWDYVLPDWQSLVSE